MLDTHNLKESTVYTSLKFNFPGQSDLFVSVKYLSRQKYKI